ncbi:hypothetical protein F3Y22_tig00117005pilonHSYRG00369 [Hibiscus syriacus]|uniref:Uncharacterized protein n=1 Tax=Hibiscus syriacus TaxID=106335 RepID=A0A6A2WDA8_HIBSY|nr:hypothetical protein F3Y22_tig00117005pilonHSYRG00369 [Hibiscus syriacus]
METGCGPKAANLVPGSPSTKNGPSEALPADPALMEAPQMPKSSEEDVKAALGSAPEGDDEPQLDEMKAGNPGTPRIGSVSKGDSDPLPEQVESESTDESSSYESSLDSDSSDLLPSDSSDSDAIAARPTTPFSPLIMEQTQSFSLALAEKIPQSGADANQSSSSGKPAQASQLKIQTDSALEAQPAQPQRAKPLDKGKKIMVADDLGKNKGKGRINDNLSALRLPNLFPRAPTGIVIRDRESTQNNRQQAPSYLHKPLASGSQVNQAKATNISDSLCRNFLLPVSPTPARTQPLDTPVQQLNQVGDKPNAYSSLLQSSELPKHSLPMEHMTHQFSFEHNRVPSALGAHNSQTWSAMLHELSLPLSSLGASSQFSMIPSLQNQLHHNSEMSRPQAVQQQGLLNQTPRPQAVQQQGLLNHTPRPQTVQQGLLNHTPRPQTVQQQGLLNQTPRPQAVQQQGLLNQTPRPNPTYPTSGTSVANLILNSAILKETGGASATLSSSQEEQGASGRLGHARSRLESGESSSFKRFRREPVLPQTSSAEQVNNNPLSLLNDASSRADINSFLLNPRPLPNSLYDPMFEGLGLPIDPHLRLFAQFNKVSYLCLP